MWVGVDFKPDSAEFFRLVLKVLFPGFQGQVRGLGRCDWCGLYADSAERPADRGGSSEVGKTAGDQGNHFYHSCIQQYNNFYDTVFSDCIIRKMYPI
jgi:hypothetical protein